jgi:aminodeoxyfutalosine deaminase
LAYLQALPKVELHVHLEGSIRPGTVIELANRNSVSLPVDTPEALEAWLGQAGPSTFFGMFSMFSMCLKDAEDFERIAYEYGSEMARQNVRYSEVHFNVAYHRLRGVEFDTCFSGLTSGRQRARRDFGVDMGWILSVMRGPRLEPALRYQCADYSVATAVEGMAEGVVAVGLGGEEREGDVAQFAPFFERAIGSGLHVAPHAGEFAGHGNVSQAVDLLGATRIGHGVRSTESPDLVRRLATTKICLDLCPTSNVRLGNCPNMARHPIAALREAGVPVTVNTDDPALFGIDLNREIRHLAEDVGLAVEQVEDVLIDAVRYAFLPAARKQELEAELRAEIARLRPAYGLAARGS